MVLLLFGLAMGVTMPNVAMWVVHVVGGSTRPGIPDLVAQGLVGMAAGMVMAV